MVAEPHRLLGAMGYVHDCRRPIVQGELQVVEEPPASFCVEPGGGFVEQQQARIERERARETHSLGLAAR